MSFRTRLTLLLALMVLLSVVVVTVLVAADARQTFNRLQDQRTAAFLAQVQKELAQQGQEIRARVRAIARSESAMQIAAQTARISPDYTAYINQAAIANASQPLSFLSFVDGQGTIISSAHVPASFGYRDPLFVDDRDWNVQQPFLGTREMPTGNELALLDVAGVPIAGAKLYIVGGMRLDAEFLRSITLPQGMMLVLRRYLGPNNVSEITSSERPLAEIDQQFAPVYASLNQADSGKTIRVEATDSLPEQDVTTIPLKGIRGDSLGVLLVANSREDLISLRRRIIRNSIVAGIIVLLISIVAASLLAARMTRPIEKLSSAADEIGAGAWNTKVEVESDDEIGRLAERFNQMTAELISQRDRLIQSERVAAWRELARRLAHELKNPLFPLQITVENLLRAREQHPEQFDEVFRESADTLLAEISNLKAIIGRFSDFSKMPVPEKQTVDLNALLRETVKLLEAQLSAAGGKIIVSTELDNSVTEIQADPVLLCRVIQNLLLNAVDAMPHGGTLTLRSRRLLSSVLIEVSDTGAGIRPEESERLFTPYYTTKTHGTGLGLAIVQSVVSDHQGKISVKSKPGKGTTFAIELPVAGQAVPVGAFTQ